MNKNCESKKNNAGSVLTDEIVDVFGKIDKAMALMQEVTSEYFQRYDGDNKEDRLDIAYDFKRAGLYASVVEDYVFEAKKAVMELVVRSQNTFQEFVEEDEDIERKRRFLREKFPEMAEITEMASNKSIELGFEMMFLDEEQRKEFEKFLIAKGKIDHVEGIYSEAEQGSDENLHEKEVKNMTNEKCGDGYE